MSVKVEKVSGCKVALHFTLKPEEFDVALDKAFEKVIKDREEPGFRKGKMPKAMFIRKYGVESLYNEALDYAINVAFIDAVQSKKLEIVSEPNVDIDWNTLGQGKKLKFTINVEVYPTVTLGEYKGLNIKKEAVKVSKKDVDEYIDRILKQHSEMEVVEGVALEKGHTAVFDFDGSVDGVHFEGGQAKDYSLEIGSGAFIPGFEDQMVGMNIGEKKNINVKFPEDYHAEDLKGKDAVFEVELHEIKQRKIPTLTDEFVKEELEIKDVNNVKEYKDFVKDVIKKDKTETAENKFTDDCVTKAIENATLEVPEGMVDTEVSHQMRQIESQAKMYGLTVDVLLKYSGIDSVDTYKQTIRPSALMAVKQRLVMDAIAKAEKLKVNKADYDAEIKLIMKETGKTEEEVTKTYTKEALTPYILLQKAIKFVKDNVKVEDKKTEKVSTEEVSTEETSVDK
jgi:trigger factor